MQPNKTMKMPTRKKEREREKKKRTKLANNESKWNQKRFSHLWIFHSLNRFIPCRLAESKQTVLATRPNWFPLWRFLCVNAVCSLAHWICQIILRPLKCYSRFGDCICISTLSIRIFDTTNVPTPFSLSLSLSDFRSLSISMLGIMYFMHSPVTIICNSLCWECTAWYASTFWIYQTFSDFPLSI